MTNEELLEDLKQYVSSTVSQATANLATREDVEHSIAASEERLMNRLNDVQDGIAETFTKSIEATESRLQSQIDDHGERLRRLETHSA